jgi:hypothetical protein
MKMKKKQLFGSIYTLNGYTNYGNRLQLFALSKTLRSMGKDVVIYWPKSIKQRIKYFIKLWTPLALLFPKERKLRCFSKKYTSKCSSKISKVAIIGSDQVWNPKYLAMRRYLLDAPECTEKISYAASVGAEKLTKEELDMFSRALKSYKAISVREKSAKDLLQPLVQDKKIEVVLDPTLLLDEAEYAKLEKRPKDVRKNERYILCYILGDQKYQETIKKYANENKLRIIAFSDRHDSNYGVEEFLYLIHHAELICTDSFHACVFSFIFDRPFVVFKRSGKENYMYTRLQNLLDTFSLKNREYNGTEITSANILVDYAEAKKILAKERKKSINYLKEALGGNE